MIWGYNPPFITSILRPHPSELAVREASHQFDDDSDGEVHLSSRDAPACQSQPVAESHNAVVGIQVVTGNQSTLSQLEGSQSAPSQSDDSQSAPFQPDDSQSAPSQPDGSQSELSHSGCNQLTLSVDNLSAYTNLSTTQSLDVATELSAGNYEGRAPGSVSVPSNNEVTSFLNIKQLISYSMDQSVDKYIEQHRDEQDEPVDRSSLNQHSECSGGTGVVGACREPGTRAECAAASRGATESGTRAERGAAAVVEASAESEGVCQLESTASTDLSHYMTDSDTLADGTKLSLQEELSDCTQLSLQEDFTDILAADSLSSPDALSSLPTSVLNELTHLDVPTMYCERGAVLFDGFDFVSPAGRSMSRRCQTEPLHPGVSHQHNISDATKGEDSSGLLAWSLMIPTSTAGESKLTVPSSVRMSFSTSPVRTLDRHPTVSGSAIVQQPSVHPRGLGPFDQCPPSGVESASVIGTWSTSRALSGSAVPARAEGVSLSADDTAASAVSRARDSSAPVPAAICTARKTPARRLSFTLDSPSPLLVEYLQQQRREAGAAFPSSRSVLEPGEVPLGWGRRLRRLPARTAVYGVRKRRGLARCVRGSELYLPRSGSTVVHSARTSPAHSPAPHADLRSSNHKNRCIISDIASNHLPTKASHPTSFNDNDPMPVGTPVYRSSPASSPCDAETRHISSDRSPGYRSSPASSPRHVTPNFDSRNAGRIFGSCSMRRVQSSPSGFLRSSPSSTGRAPADRYLASAEADDDEDGTLTPSTGRCASVSSRPANSILSGSDPRQHVAGAMAARLTDQLSQLYISHARQLSDEIARHRRRRHLLESHMRCAEDSVLEQFQRMISTVDPAPQLQHGHNRQPTAGSQSAYSGPIASSTGELAFQSVQTSVAAMLRPTASLVKRVPFYQPDIAASAGAGGSGAGTSCERDSRSGHVPIGSDRAARTDSAVSVDVAAVSTASTASDRSTLSSLCRSPARSAQSCSTWSTTEGGVFGAASSPLSAGVAADEAPLPASRRAAAAASSSLCSVVVPPEALRSPRLQRCFSRVTAAVRGYLTRRLLATDKVQSVIYTAREAMRCALRLQQEVECQQQTGAAPSLIRQDLQLYERLINQVYGACHALHRLFVEAPVGERMAVISADRAACLLAQTTSTELDGVISEAARHPPQVSRATLQRRRARLSTSTKPGSRRSAGSSASSQNGKHQQRGAGPRRSAHGMPALSCQQQGLKSAGPRSPLHHRPWH